MTNETATKAARRLAGPMFDRGFRPAALHAYTDAGGKPLFWRIRCKHPDTGEKWIRPMKLNGHGYELGEPRFEGKKPLYRLDRLAGNTDAVVWIAEGEQKVDALEKLGNLATTSGGATSAAGADWEPLRGRACRIWPDNDDPGRAYAGEVAAILLGMGCTVSCIDAEKLGLGKGEDVIDWLAAHPGAAGCDIEALPILRLHQTPEDAQAGDSASCDPEPMPLPKLPPVPAFPMDLLPDELKPWIGDGAERARFRPEFPAVASMVALGSVIGRKLGIRLKKRDDWTEYANVWGGLIGPPSALKSPAMRAGLRPFKVLQVTADERHATEREAYEARLEAFKLRKNAKRKSAVKALTENADASIDLGDLAEPTIPMPRTYWTSDATAERLGELLAENPNGLLVERDELSALLMTLEDERYATARGLYLSGWSGNEGYRFDRIMRGTTALPKFALSVIGGIQPGPLTRYVRSAFSGERADGMLQRFQLIVWPDAESFVYVDRWPDGDARKTAAALFERADSFDPKAIGTHDGCSNDPPFIRLSREAQGLFVEWYSNFMRERRTVESGGSESAPIAAHFGKYPGLVGKLALILHVADDPESGEVSERTLLKALAWIDYLTPHARRVYHAVEHPETGAAELLLARLRRGELPPSFKAWEISRKGWHGLTDREAVKKACRLLLEYGWLIELDAGGSSGGRPADPVYGVSPAAKVTP